MTSPIRSLIITFQNPIGIYLGEAPLCGEDGSFYNIMIDEKICYVDESPLLIQPDVLFDDNGNAVGISFDLTSSWLKEACIQMLIGLNPKVCFFDEERSILICRWNYLADNTTLVCSQLEFGAWAFLYRSPDPTLFQDGEWSKPLGMMLPDFTFLDFDVSWPKANIHHLSVFASE